MLRPRSRGSSAAIVVAAIAAVACVRGGSSPEAAPASATPAAAETPILEGELGGDEAPPASPTRSAIPEPIVELPAGSDLTLLHDGLANALLSAPGVVVLLEEDFRHLRAIDADSGAVRWRMEAQTAPSGRHSLHRVGDRIFLHAGARMIAVDLPSGRRLGESPAYYNGNDMGCRFDVGAGACAHRCDCVVQPVSCATGAAIGGGWRSDESHIYHDLAQGHDTVCFRPPGLVGGVGELTVVHHSEGPGGPEVVAVDASGDVRWRTQAIAAGLERLAEAGADPASDVCWVGEWRGELRFFRCSNGQVLFDMSKGTDEIREGDLRGLAGGRIWISRGGPKGGGTTVREASAGGRVVWRRSLAPGEFALPLGARVGEVYFGRPRRLVFLDPERGREVFALDLGERDGLADDRGGGYVRSGDDLQELDERGQLRRRRPRPIEGLWMATPTHLVTQVEVDGSRRIEALRREDLTPALRLDARLAVVDGEPAAATSLVFLLHRGDQPARALVLR